MFKKFKKMWQESHDKKHLTDIGIKLSPCFSVKEMKFTIFKMSSFTVKKNFKNICPVYQLLSWTLKTRSYSARENEDLMIILFALWFEWIANAILVFKVQKFASFKKNFNLWLFLSRISLAFNYLMCLICLILDYHLAHYY